MYKKALIFILLIFTLSGCLDSSVDSETEKSENPIVIVKNNILHLSISIDGDISDWNDANATLVDSANDGGNYSGLDITGMYVAKDANNLYIRFDRVGTEVPSNEYSNTWIYFDKTAQTNSSFAIELFRDEGNLLHPRVWDTSADEGDYFRYVQVTDSAIRYNLNNPSVELSIPLSYLNLESEYTLRFFTHYSIGLNWEDNNGDISDERVILQIP